MNLEHIPTLNEEELNQLGNLLENEYEQQDSLDFFATHGALSALLLSPKAYHIEQLQDLMFTQKPDYSTEEQALLISLLNKLSIEISAYLDSGEDFPIPCELSLELEDDEEDIAPLQSWCTGFVAVVLAQEDDWYNKQDENLTAQLLFPILYASGLFLEEEEMAQIDADAALSNQVCSHIPANITELYLLYHGV